MAQSRTYIALLTRVRAMDGTLLQLKTEDLPVGRVRCRSTFISLENAPEFDGESAWFEMERVPATPWPYWRAIRQVEPPAGWVPTPQVRRHPRELLGHR